MIILPEMHLSTRESAIKFLPSSASKSRSRNFCDNSSLVYDRAFSHNLAHISGKYERVFMDILLEMYLWTKKSPRNYGVIRNRLGGGPRSPSDLVLVLGYNYK